jgi:hypothetical protein
MIKTSEYGQTVITMAITKTKSRRNIRKLQSIRNSRGLGLKDPQTEFGEPGLGFLSVTLRPLQYAGSLFP